MKVRQAKISRYFRKKLLLTVVLVFGGIYLIYRNLFELGQVEEQRLALEQDLDSAVNSAAAASDGSHSAKLSKMASYNDDGLEEEYAEVKARGAAETTDDDAKNTYYDNSNLEDYHDILPTLSIPFCFQEYVETGQYFVLQDCVIRLNREIAIQNADVKFASSSTAQPTVIALVVHKRANYLRIVLEHLKQVKHIWSALLVVSHDGYFEEVHRLVQSIDFCRVKQVYHPFSNGLLSAALAFANKAQETPSASDLIYKTLPDGSWLIEFGYEDPVNSFLADKHLKPASVKQHYWWLWNYVYSQYADIPHSILAHDTDDETADFDVIFLEEDHLVLPDLLVAFDGLRSLKEKFCPQCFGYNLGHQLFQNEELSAPNRASAFEAKYGVLSNLGIALSKSSFKMILAQKEEFCSYNDYNWDLTLFHMQQKAFIPETSISLSFSRVYHIGLCGMHIKNENCDPQKLVDDVRETIVAPLRAIYRDSAGKFNFNPQWRDEPFSRRPTMTGVEGWINGRLWKADGSVEHFWTSDINYDHCINMVDIFSE